MRTDNHTGEVYLMYDETGDLVGVAGSLDTAKAHLEETLEGKLLPRYGWEGPYKGWGDDKTWYHPSNYQKLRIESQYFYTEPPEGWVLGKGRG